MMGRRDARHRIVRLHVMDDEIAGDADRDRVAERRHLADGKPRDLAEKPLHGPASPSGCPLGAPLAPPLIQEVCGGTKLIFQQNKATAGPS